MKKYLVFFMVVAISLSCAFAQGNKEEVGDSSGEQISLNWWTWDEDMQETNKVIIAKYEESHPNVTVTNTRKC
jgi:ABC-type glycerol-3-phosphate transport system substrate-binding protein